MAQDRINYLCQRLSEGAAIARVIRAARDIDSNVSYGSKLDLANATGVFTVGIPTELLSELQDAMRDLHNAAYIELPDDCG